MKGINLLRRQTVAPSSYLTPQCRDVILHARVVTIAINISHRPRQLLNKCSHALACPSFQQSPPSDSFTSLVRQKGCSGLAFCSNRSDRPASNNLRDKPAGKKEGRWDACSYSNFQVRFVESSDKEDSRRKLCDPRSLPSDSDVFQAHPSRPELPQSQSISNYFHQVLPRPNLPTLSTIL